MGKRIFGYNMIRGIVDYVIEWYHDDGIAIRLEKREIEARGALDGMTHREVRENIFIERSTVS